MDAQEILDTLDSRYYEWFEPVINPIETHFRVADTRLTVFRSAEHWVLFFEIVQYNARSDEYETGLYAYGNCLQEKSEDGMDLNQSLYAFYRHPFEFDEAETPVNSETDSWILHRDRFSIHFNGQRLELVPTPEDYAAAGIVFEPDMEGPDTIEPEQLLRFLCHHLDHPFFNSEDYLRSIIDVFQTRPEEPVFRQTGLSHHLALFLQTYAWQHTDFNAENEYECPSDIPGFHILARAIASGDLTEWNRQDPATFNTDWHPWEAERRAEKARTQAFCDQQAQAFAQLPLEMQEEITRMQQNMAQHGGFGRLIIASSVSADAEDGEQP